MLMRRLVLGPGQLRKGPVTLEGVTTGFGSWDGYPPAPRERGGAGDCGVGPSGRASLQPPGAPRCELWRAHPSVLGGSTVIAREGLSPLPAPQILAGASPYSETCPCSKGAFLSPVSRHSGL